MQTKWNAIEIEGSQEEGKRSQSQQEEVRADDLCMWLPKEGNREAQWRGAPCVPWILQSSLQVALDWLHYIAD